MRIGRGEGTFEGIEELSDLVLSVVVDGIGGGFVGRFEIVFTIRCRS